MTANRNCGQNRKTQKKSDKKLTNFRPHNGRHVDAPVTPVLLKMAWNHEIWAKQKINLAVGNPDRKKGGKCENAN